MSENYVDDREFRSEIRRIEQKVENAVERIELKMDVYTARVDTMLAKMDGRIGKLEARVDGIGNFIGWTIGIAAIIITIGTFVFQIIAK